MYIGRERQLVGRVIKCAGHLHIALNPDMLAKTIPLIVSHLSHYDFDAIAFRGLSGALVAPIVAMQMGKTLIAVRRRNESRHTTHLAEGDLGARRYVILDDFICSGDTVRAIVSGIEAEFTDGGLSVPECIGVLQYCYLDEWRERWSLTDVTRYTQQSRRIESAKNLPTWQPSPFSVNEGVLDIETIDPNQSLATLTERYSTYIFRTKQ